jgi:hypothetical protein
MFKSWKVTKLRLKLVAELDRQTNRLTLLPNKDVLRLILIGLFM